ncbi:MAG: enoyl-CoA hydratase/isomerase family protein [Reyranellaceae bacterium]
MPDQPNYQHIRLEIEGWVARLTFARPARRNALTFDMMVEIKDAILRVGADSSLRALVLRGEGGYYCAGGDLNTMTDMPEIPPGGTDPLIPSYRLFGDALLALNGLPQAVISAVEGPAIGGGFGMVCCSDVVIVHENARFGIPEPRVGFIPSQIVPFIVRRIGEGATRHLAVTGTTLSGIEAVAAGIGRKLVHSEFEMNNALDETLENVRRMEPAALASVKRLVLSCATERDVDVLDAAASDLVSLLRKPAARQGIGAFMDKSLPPWAAADIAKK